MTVSPSLLKFSDFSPMNNIDIMSSSDDRKDNLNSQQIRSYDPYESPANWLRSLRLHKYADNFKGYTLQMMIDLDEGTLAKLIITQGGRTKFKKSLGYLTSQGFKGFGCGENSFLSEEIVNYTVGYAVSPPWEGYVINTHHDNSNTAVEERPIQNLTSYMDNHAISTPISIQEHSKKEMACNYIGSHGTSPGDSHMKFPDFSPMNNNMLNRDNSLKDSWNSKKFDTFDPFESPSNWLRSLRMHKYADKFEGYTLQMMIDLDEETLEKLIVTQGARRRYREKLEHLVNHGFKGFGCGKNPFVDNESINLPSNQAALSL